MLLKPPAHIADFHVRTPLAFTDGGRLERAGCGAPGQGLPAGLWAGLPWQARACVAAFGARAPGFCRCLAATLIPAQLDPPRLLLPGPTPALPGWRWRWPWRRPLQKPCRG